MNFFGMLYANGTAAGCGYYLVLSQAWQSYSHSICVAAVSLLDHLTTIRCHQGSVLEATPSLLSYGPINLLMP